MKWFLFFSLLNLSFLVFSQQYRFIEYSVPEGLAQSQVTSILQDKNGYIWIGTQGGLSKFDGINFTNYSCLDGLSGNLISILKNDRQNTLWIGSNRGLTSFNGIEFKSYPFPKKYLGNSVSDIAFFNNKIYVSVNGEGLFVLQNNQLQKIINQEKINPKIRALIVKNDTLIIGTRQGIRCISKKNEIHNYSQYTDDFSISSLEKYGDSLIVGTYGEGVYVIKNGIRKQYKFKKKLYNRPRKISVSQDGVIWLTSRYGIIKINKENHEIISDKKGLPTNDIFSSFIDSEQNVWFGSSGNGLLKLTSFSFTNFTTKNGLVSNKVMAINQDFNNNIWFGTFDKGISIWNGREFKTISHKEGLKNLTIRSVFFDSNEVLLATYKGLLSFKTNQKQIKVKQKYEELKDKRITCIHKDHKNNYWIGTIRSVWMKTKDSLIELNPKKWKYGGMVRKITSDLQNNIHIITSSGYYKFIKNSLIKIPLFIKKNHEATEVNSILFDKNNNAIIGTSNGLFIQKGNHFILRKIGSKFNENIINFIELDKHNVLYIGTNNGLFVSSMEKLLNDNKALSKFGVSHGLNSVETNLGSSFIDKNGNLWFGTARGVVNQTNNQILLQKQYTPKLQITDFQLFFNSKKTSQNNYILPREVQLKSKENHITFKYIGLLFKDPTNVEYQYRLKGVENKWSPKSKTNSITFSDLNPGNYIFEVRSSYGGGHWSNSEKFKFTIKSPYYLSWWFIFILFIVFISIVYVVLKSRINQLNRKKETEKIIMQGRLLSLEQKSLNASMNRHFIFNSLNSIQYYVNTKDRISANKYLTNFAKLIRKNLDSSTAKNNLVSIQDEIDRLKLYLSLEMMRFQNKFSYQMNIQPNVDTEDILIPSMMLQPFVENSIIHGILPKNSNNGMIEINIKNETNNFILIEIKDNGIGIDESKIKKQTSIGDHLSHGMKITQSRIEILKELTNKNLKLVGPKQIHDQNGLISGTYISIKIPIKNVED